MAQNIQILKSKLTVPHDSGIVYRKRLYPLLDDIRYKRLTVVSAGAGYGKTTLIADAMRHLQLTVVWYRLDRTDRDFNTVMAYLVEGVRESTPNFGEHTQLRMQKADFSSLGREAILKTFIAELESSGQEKLTIVFDDFHLIGESREIKEAMLFLIENAPRSLHLIFISRTEPELSLSRFRAGREVLDIGEEDLIFSLDETRQLFEKLFRVSIPEKNLKTLHRKTEGWISGLILFYNSLRGKSEEKVVKLLDGLKGSQKIIASFLEENVYNIQPESVRNFLKQTSILSRVGADFCDTLLGINDSALILEQLEEKHLFTFPVDEDRKWFIYHHLFQDFLKSRLCSDTDASGIRNLHKSAAQVWEQIDALDEAIEHYVQAEEYASACILLRKMGRSAIAKGCFQLVMSVIDRIPESYLDKEPWVQYSYGRALEFAGNRTQAVSVFNRAMDNFSRQNLEKGARVCLFTLANSYYMTGDFPKADHMLCKLLDKIENNPGFVVSILGSLVFISSHQGRMETADQYFNKAVAIDPELKTGEPLAWLYFNRGFRFCFAGEFKKALDFGFQVDQMCQREKLSYTQVFNYHLISWSLYYLHRYEEGIRYAMTGLEMAKREGYQDTSYAWLLTDLALNVIGSGNGAAAINHCMEAIRIFKEQSTTWGETWAYHILYDAYKADGRPEEAESYLVKGIDLLKNLTLPLQEGMLKKRLAERSLARCDWENARLLLKDCEAAFQSSSLYSAIACFCTARLHWLQRKQAAALKKMKEALSICRHNQYDHIVSQEKDWILPLLDQARSEGIMKDYIDKILSQPGFDTGDEGLQTMTTDRPSAQVFAGSKSHDPKQSDCPALRIQCLGEFRVFRGTEEIGQSCWHSKKALKVFKYLVHSRPHGYVHKEVLIDLIWPDVGPGKASGRLHDALSALRKTLEPGKSGVVKSTYLKREASSYKLCLGEGGAVDVEAFKSLLKQAAAANATAEKIEQYLKAETLYAGDFLEEDRFSNWCEEEREQLKSEYLNLIEQLMSHFEMEQLHEKSIEYAVKYLKKDKYAEHVYQRLMKYYATVNNTSMLSRTYMNCRDNIREGLDQSVSRETEQLYQQLKTR